VKGLPNKSLWGGDPSGKGRTLGKKELGKNFAAGRCCGGGKRAELGTQERKVDHSVTRKFNSGLNLAAGRSKEKGRMGKKTE